MHWPIFWTASLTTLNNPMNFLLSDAAANLLFRNGNHVDTA